ncbi:MAG: hypothetical protein U0787_23085 [Polyangia bacterium]
MRAVAAVYFQRIAGQAFHLYIVDGENRVAYREGGDPFPTPPNFHSGVSSSRSRLAPPARIRRQRRE